MNWMLEAVRVSCPKLVLLLARWLLHHKLDLKVRALLFVSLLYHELSSEIRRRCVPEKKYLKCFRKLQKNSSMSPIPFAKGEISKLDSTERHQRLPMHSPAWIFLEARFPTSYMEYVADIMTARFWVYLPHHGYPIIWHVNSRVLRVCWIQNILTIDLDFQIKNTWNTCCLMHSRLCGLMDKTSDF